MKRFRFPLRPIAVLRAHREMQAQEAFAAAVRAVTAAEEALAATRGRITRLAEAMNAQREGAFSPAEAAETYRAYRLECEEAVRDERRVAETKEAMQRARNAYHIAHRDVKVVQRLEEKARAAHRLEFNRAEQAAIDEFANLSPARRRPALS